MNASNQEKDSLRKRAWEWFKLNSMQFNWIVVAALIAGLFFIEDWTRFLLGFARFLPFAFLFVMALGEYFTHRIFMHKRRRGFTEFYKIHHVEHHGQGVNHGIHMDQSSFFHHLIALPLYIGLAISAYNGETKYWMGGAYSIGTMYAISLSFLHHSLIWTATHRAIHGVRMNRFDKWIVRQKGYAWRSIHHEIHHQRPNKNYGVVYRWPDWLFGTLITK